ncbi:hypothetical protein ACJX0J_038574, partial [Zea mays]
YLVDVSLFVGFIIPSFTLDWIVAKSLQVKSVFFHAFFLEKNIYMLPAGAVDDNLLPLRRF